MTSCAIGAIESVQAAPADGDQVSGYLERGKHFYRLKDFASAIQTWGKVLAIDPLNEDALELIDEAKFQAEYHVAVLDRLDREKRLKTPYAPELTKMADEMLGLLNEAESMLDREQEQALTSVSAEDAKQAMAEKQAYIQQIFDQGMALYQEGNYAASFVAWEKILSVLPEEDALSVKIAELKANVEILQQKKGDSPKVPKVKEGLIAKVSVDTDSSHTPPAAADAIFPSATEKFSWAGAVKTYGIWIGGLGLALLVMIFGARMLLVRKAPPAFIPKTPPKMERAAPGSGTFDPRELAKVLAEKSKKRNAEMERELLS